MTDKAAAFLKRWTRAHLPANCDPGLRVGKATTLARQCRSEAAKVGISNEDLTLAGYGNLVVYFQDALAIAATARHGGNEPKGESNR